MTEDDYIEMGNTMIEIIRKNWCPERSKREDLPSWAKRAIMMPDGKCHFEDGTIIDSQQPIEEGCGALNSQETD